MSLLGKQLDDKASLGRELIQNAHVGIDRKLRMLQGTARILSKNYGVNVIFSLKGECQTTSTVMKLPYDEAVHESIIMGLMGHETGHVKATDFSVGKTISKMRNISNRELLFYICNSLEDVRIERIMEEAYAGFKDMFRESMEHIRVKKAPILPELPALQKILDLIFLQLREYDYSWYPEDIALFVEEFVLPTASKINEPSCNSTKEVLKVAVEVYDILANANKVPQPDDFKTKSQKKEASIESDSNTESNCVSIDEQDSEAKEDTGTDSSPPNSDSKQGKEKKLEASKENDTQGNKSPQSLKTEKFEFKVGMPVKHLTKPGLVGKVIEIDEETKGIKVDWQQA